MKIGLLHVANHGFRTIDNQAKKRKDGLEGIFEEARKKTGVEVSRARCVFAYPRRPEQIRYGMTFNTHKQILVEAKVNPKNSVVANGECYSEASDRLDSPLSAQGWASEYWETAKPLKQYMAEGHDGSDDDRTDFNFPEVLIPENIPTDVLRVVDRTKEKKVPRKTKNILFP